MAPAAAAGPTMQHFVQRAGAAEHPADTPVEESDKRQAIMGIDSQLRAQMAELAAEAACRQNGMQAGRQGEERAVLEVEDLRGKLAASRAEAAEQQKLAQAAVEAALSEQRSACEVCLADQAAKHAQVLESLSKQMRDEADSSRKEHSMQLATVREEVQALQKRHAAEVAAMQKGAEAAAVRVQTQLTEQLKDADCQAKDQAQHQMARHASELAQVWSSQETLFAMLTAKSAMLLRLQAVALTVHNLHFAGKRGACNRRIRPEAEVDLSGRRLQG